MQVGNLQAMVGAMFANFRPEVRANDPELSSLTNKQVAVIWFNSTDQKYKYFDGTAIKELGSGGSGGGDFLPLAGGTMTGPMELDNEEMPNEPKPAAPVPYKWVQAELAKKMSKLTGLGGEAVLVTTSDGDITVSAVTAAELGFLTGATSNIQEQLDNKMSSGDLALTGDLNAGSFQIINLGAPQGPQYALRKMDLDAAMENIPAISSAKTVVRDASLVPEKVEGARYLIADKDQIHPDFGTPEALVNWCVLQYDTEQQGFYTAWIPEARLSGTMIYIDDKANYFEYSGTEFKERIKGQAPQSGTATLVEADGKVNVQYDTPISLTDDGKLTIKINTDMLEYDSADGLQLKQGGVSLQAIDAEAFGTGLEIVEGKLVVNLDISGFIKSGDTVESLKVSGAPTEDTDVINKKYFDDNKGSGASATPFVYTASAAASEHTVTHNLGRKYCTVTVYVEDAVIQPSAVTAVDANNLTVTLPEDKECVVVVF